jgi:hypothetical protein
LFFEIDFAKNRGLRLSPTKQLKRLANVMLLTTKEKTEPQQQPGCNRRKICQEDVNDVFDRRYALNYPFLLVCVIRNFVDRCASPIQFPKNVQLSPILLLMANGRTKSSVVATVMGQ